MEEENAETQRIVRKEDPEITAIKAVDRAMEKLPDGLQRERVLSYIESKYIPPRVAPATVAAAVQ